MVADALETVGGSYIHGLFCGGENVKNFKLCQRMESMLFCRSHPVAMKMKGLKCNNKCVAMKAKEMIAVEKQLH